MIVNGRIMTPELSAAWNKARAAKRLAGPAPEYPPMLDYGSRLGVIVVGNSLGEWHDLEVFHSPRRRDSLLVMVDGRLWRKQVGRHQLGLKVADSLGRLFAEAKENV